MKKLFVTFAILTGIAGISSAYSTEVNALIDESGARKSVRYMTDDEAKRVVKSGGCIEKFPDCSMNTRCVCNAGDPAQLQPPEHES